MIYFLFFIFYSICSRRARALYFGREQVFWGCEEEGYSEDWLVRVPTSFYSSTIRTKARPPWKNGWRQVVEGYSRCRLSFG
jgi:hypothetical protein